MTLGDRVAVMRAGVLQQVDAPQELYQHPINLFVAGFMGSPSMNFFSATVENDRVRFALGEFALPDQLRGTANGEVILGIRPEEFEDAALVGDKPGHVFEAPVSLVESLGSEVYAHIEYEEGGAEAEELAELAADSGSADLPSSEQNQAVARLEPATDVKAGASARLWIDTSKVHLFDPSNGKSLTVEKARQAAGTD
jgi:multiple sugar transport system ATP-binding protein